MSKKTYIQFILMIALLLALLSPAQADQKNIPFFDCGVLLQGSDCVLFAPYGDSISAFEIDSLAGFGAGDWVYVAGILDLTCNSSCQRALGCLHVDSIYECTSQATFIQTCGTLTQGTNCLLFTPDIGQFGGNDHYLQLDYYGSFGAMDSVCLTGFVSFEPVPECPDADGFIVDVEIDAWSPMNAPFSGCGVLVPGSGCMIFMPYDSMFGSFTLANYGSFGAYDTVCVTGFLDFTCDPICPEAIGCIYDNSIYLWNNPGAPFDACGILYDIGGCTVFQGWEDTLTYAVEFLGDFSPGDTVCISGALDFSCDLGCAGVAGCIINGIVYDRMDYIPGSEVIIKMVTGYEIAGSIVPFSGVVIDSIDYEDTYLTAFPDTVIIELIIDSLNSLPEVIFAQPNFNVEFPESYHVSQSFPDDQMPPLLDGVSPPNYFSEEYGYNFKCDSAQLFTRGENIVIAIIDNGLDFSHPLFIGGLADNGYDFIDEDNYPDEETGAMYGHGTFVAGVIKRVAPDAKLIPIRVFDGNGGSSSYDVANAIRYAISQSVDIINMSFGSYSSNPIVQEAVADAVSAGITLVAAAGNDNANLPSYPSAYPGVIAVSATDSLDYRADFSNYGSYIDICTRGTDIYSSLAGTYQWGIWSGTSFSAPMISGVCALILSKKGDLDALEIESYIQSATDTLFLWGQIERPHDDEYGYGKVNALRPVYDASLGDLNNSNDLNLIDVIYLLDFLYSEGPSPDPMTDLADVNCNGIINLLDATMMIEYLYSNGNNPTCLK